MIALDHVGVPARDAAASARFLSEVLGLAPATPAGPEGEMYCLPIGESGALLFSPTDSVAALHAAFASMP